MPILRGEFDADAPPDPAVRVSGRPLVDGEFVLGSVIALALVLAGSALWFLA